MLLTLVQLASALILVMFVPAILYIASAELASRPWSAWTLALLSTVVAMGMRGLAQDIAQARYRDPGAPRQIPWLLMSAPPALIALAMALLALLLWGVRDCSWDTGHLCDRWTRLEQFAVSTCSIRGFHWSGCSIVAGGIQALGIASVYLAGLLVWIVWWAKRESHKDKFSERFIRQVGVGVFSTALMIFLTHCLVAVVDPMSLITRPAVPPQGAPLGVATQPHLWGALILGTPILFALFYVVSLVQIGLTFFTDQDRVTRERWARLMGQSGLWVLLGNMPSIRVAGAGSLAGPQIDPGHGPVEGLVDSSAVHRRQCPGCAGRRISTRPARSIRRHVGQSGCATLRLQGHHGLSYWVCCCCCPLGST